jgi:hypothetical protein
MKAIKVLQKNGTIWVVKHTFVWQIVYEQCVANMNVRVSRKENITFLVENWLVRFIWEEMQISHTKLLIKHSQSMYRDFCFVPNLIKIVINIVMLAYRPNIHLELGKVFLQEFLQSTMENDDARTSIKARCD